MLSLITILLVINSFDAGIQFGPNFPAGNVERYYQVSTASSVCLEINNFKLDYTFSKFNGKLNNREYFYLHSGTFSCQYPLYKKTNRALNASLGGSYNRIIRNYGTAQENGYALGVRYGIGYIEHFGDNSFMKELRPALLSNIYLTQLLETRNWNSMQITSSNYIISVMLGISFSL